MYFMNYSKCFLWRVFFLLQFCYVQNSHAQTIDKFWPLPANAIQLHGYLENDIQNSLTNWNMGVVPYDSLALLFKNGRAFFAQGEMWGKAVRSGCMLYRYQNNPKLKEILKNTVYKLISYKKENGSISCSAPDSQPDGPGGDIWERKYVLLALEGYYTDVEKDTVILKELIQQADILISQVGPAPKVRIVDLGWSPNHIESSTVLEPIMRLYNYTSFSRYLDFAKYIVEVEGGAKGYNIIEDAYNGKDPAMIGGVYPKAYEMMSLFEGLLEYYRVTKNEKWKLAAIRLFENIKRKEITIIGNGGGDKPYHPSVMGEAWDYTALEQTNPDVERMMETCVGVTWLKLCSQIFRLTGDVSTIDMIEKYAYNGLLGAMKPGGDGFSYVNLLNGIKTNPVGWGGIVNNVNVTCCNLNGPMGLAYLPFVAVMNSPNGPVINLFNSSTSDVELASGNNIKIELTSAFPENGAVNVKLSMKRKELFSVKIRIPAWSENTTVFVNNKPYKTKAGSYLDIARKWSDGDIISMKLDMRCRIIEAPKGSNRKGDNFTAVMAGPIVLARDENMDKDFNNPVQIISIRGFIKGIPSKPDNPMYRLQYSIPSSKGYIKMVDYSSINNWNGKRICTWLPGR